MGVDGIKCAVTGGCGFVGHRLVEMLAERGAAEVVAFDISPPPAWKSGDKRIRYVQGDMTNPEEVEAAFAGVDCVWHIGALVGPYHPKDRYMAVNYHGTLNVIAACQKLGIHKIVMSSSPATRMDGSHVSGVREEDMKTPDVFMQDYAESKALGEDALRASNNPPELMTVAIAPHQLYGPHDALFLSNILNAAESGMLRIFGRGTNEVAFTHVDNYCHGLILGFDALYPDSPALAQFYVVTDGGKVNFWDAIDEAVVGSGYASLKTRFSLPYYFILIVAYICNGLGWILNRKFKLTPYTVRMLVIDRWFDISNARRDLKYEPLLPFEDGWSQTIAWFNDHKEWRRSMAARTGKVSEAKKMK